MTNKPTSEAAQTKQTNAPPMAGEVCVHCKRAIVEKHVLRYCVIPGCECRDLRASIAAVLCSCGHDQSCHPRIRVRNGVAPGTPCRVEGCPCQTWFVRPDDAIQTIHGFDDYLPLSAVRIAPGEYEVKDRSGRTLWHMEGASLADWVCASANGYNAMQGILANKTTHDITTPSATEIAEDILAPAIGKVHPEIYINMVEAVARKIDTRTPSTPVHPENEAVAHQLIQEHCDINDLGRLRSAIVQALVFEREQNANVAFREINNAGFNELAAVTADVIRDRKGHDGQG